MGLIYVNPEGPGGKPDPVAAAHDIRETFARMAMDDEETAALIIGGHTFGKTHGAAPGSHVGPEPEGAPIEQQGLGWRSDHGSGKGPDTTTSGLEGAWTNDPIRWDNGFLENLYQYEWELTTSPAGAKQWRPAGGAGGDSVPDAHDPAKRHAPMMLTTDLSMRMDPKYAAISERFRRDPAALADAFGKAWYKLLHRDMGPVSRYLGPWVPPPQLWQDPVPPVEHALVDEGDVGALKARVLASGLSVPELVRTAWAAASSFRATDKRGGANGARLRLDPQRTWDVNEPAELGRILTTLETVRADFERTGKRVSLADLIVIAGCAGVEEAARAAGVRVTVPFVPGRTDATQEQTDVRSFAVLELTADGFRNYLQPGQRPSPETLLLERANLLSLSAPEMTALLGGMRVLGVNHGGSADGVFTSRRGALTNDFFVNLLDPRTAWSKVGDGRYEGRDRSTGAPKWTATAVDLVFGAHGQLRAICEVYAASDGHERLVRDFVAAWVKVANLDRFDVKGPRGRSVADAAR